MPFRGLGRRQSRIVRVRPKALRVPAAASRRLIVTALAALATFATISAASSAARDARPQPHRARPAAKPASGPGIPGTWTLRFDDEFDGTSLEATRWHTCFWWATTTCSIESNRELELYNPDDVSVAGGALHLRAQRRDLVAWNGRTYHFSSGMVMTRGR